MSMCSNVVHVISACVVHSDYGAFHLSSVCVVSILLSLKIVCVVLGSIFMKQIVLLDDSSKLVVLPYYFLL
jgi:hypothetical protein